MRALPLLLVGLSGCAAAKLAQPAAYSPRDPGIARTVVLEPLFEMAAWRVSTRTEYARVLTTPLGTGGAWGFGASGLSTPTTVAVSRQVEEKPFFARAEVLAELHRRLLGEVQRRRPSWRVTSTGGIAALSSDVTVVRTIIEGDAVAASDRAMKNLALGFGFVLWPLQLVHIDPVHETVRVAGALERFDAPAAALPARLVKYPTQPDYAVNLSGYAPLRRPFALDVAYDEGVLAEERGRAGVLIDGFVDRLAAAAVALVEESLTPTSSPLPLAAP